jgi:hypothetical protein
MAAPLRDYRSFFAVAFDRPILRLDGGVPDHGLPATILETIPPTTRASCWPALPSRAYMTVRMRSARRAFFQSLKCRQRPETEIGCNAPSR